MPAFPFSGTGSFGKVTPDGAALCLAEAAAARSARNVADLAEALGAMRAGGVGGDEVAGLAARASAMATIEGVLEGRLADQVDVGALLDRLATLILMTSTGIHAVRTSLAARAVPAALARAVLASVHEIAHVAESQAPPGATVELCIATEVENDQMVVAVAIRGVDPAPVAADAGARAFARAGRLAALFGGEVVEGWRDGDLLVGLFVELGRDPGL